MGRGRSKRVEQGVENEEVGSKSEDEEMGWWRLTRRALSTSPRQPFRCDGCGTFVIVKCVRQIQFSRPERSTSPSKHPHSSPFTPPRRKSLSSFSYPPLFPLLATGSILWEEHARVECRARAFSPSFQSIFYLYINVYECVCIHIKH